MSATIDRRGSRPDDLPEPDGDVVSTDASEDGTSSTTNDLVSLASDSSLMLVGTVTNQGTLFLLVALVSQVLGPAALGIYTQAIALHLLLTIFAMAGLQTTMTRFVAIYLADGPPQALRGAVRLGLSLAGGFAAVLGVLLFFSAGLVASILDEPDLVTPVRLVALTVPLTVLTDIALAATQGWRSMKAFALVKLIGEPMTRLVLAIFAISAGMGVNGVLAAQLVSTLGAVVFAALQLRRRMVGIPGPAHYETRRLLRFSTPSWMASVSNTGLNWADALILGYFLTSDAVGQYQVATRLVMLATFVMFPIIQSFAPRIVDYLQRGQTDELRHTYGMTTSWLLRLSMPAFVVLVIYPQVLLRVFGPTYAVAASVTVVLVIGKFFEVASGPCGMVLNMSNHPTLNMANNVVALALNVGLNILLIPRIGVIGAAWAWTASLVVLNTARLVQVRVLIGILPVHLVMLRAVPAAIAAAVVGLVVRAVTPNTTGFGVLGIVAIMVVYLAVAMKVAVTPEDRTIAREISKAVRSRVGAAPRPAAAEGGVAAALGGIRPVRNRPAFPAAIRHRALAISGRRNVRPMTTTVRIDDLISPLRLDILVREDFLRFIRDNRDLYDVDPASFLALAAETDYRIWFEHIGLRNERPIVRRMHSFDEMYADRVRRTISLFDYLESTPEALTEQPVRLWGPTRVLPTHTGKQVSSTYFPGDGCHRLAYLRMQGVEVLEPRNTHVIRVPTLRPRDNSRRLLDRLQMNQRQYTEFLAMRYAPRESMVTLRQLIRHVRATAPSDLPQLLEVMARDGWPVADLLDDTTALSDAGRAAVAAAQR